MAALNVENDRDDFVSGLGCLGYAGIIILALLFSGCITALVFGAT